MTNSKTEPDAGWFLGRCRKVILRLLAELGLPASTHDIRDVENRDDADLAIPLHSLAKNQGTEPNKLAEECARALNMAGAPFISVHAVNGYLNFKLAPAELATAVCNDFGRNPAVYGSCQVGSGKTVVIDYSSPNIAKPFSVGHLRSTIIGQSLYNILGWLGYRVIGDNHLGDWGTQFGKLLCAFHRWGNADRLRQNPTGHLLELYVRFHNEAKTDPALESCGREWFRKLETGDQQARSLWQHFVQLSLAEFNRIYELLGVRFDSVLGESFYEDRLSGVVERALNRGVAKVERLQEGETVLIPLERAGISSPLLLRKSDGTSLYATREIATAEYRIEKWHPEMIIYVVGSEQELYFRQFSAALKLLGIDVPCIHVSFGLVRLPDGSMSTREGRVILLEDVIQEAIRRAEAVVTDRSLPETEKREIARKVGIGAIKYADLSQNRLKEVVFDWNKMLRLDGDSAPYLMYAYTRARSIIRKAATSPKINTKPSFHMLVSPAEQHLLKHIARFPDAVLAAGTLFEPCRIANRLYRIAKDFSVFYDTVPVLKAETNEVRAARLYLVEMTSTVLKTGLALLGIETSERM
ncbi:MAG: arginine--tRNA ligase [candidate division WOR-3 bacterium]